MHFTAHIYYRSIIGDLFALFGPPTDINKNSLCFIEKDLKLELINGEHFFWFKQIFFLEIIVRGIFSFLMLLKMSL